MASSSLLRSSTHALTAASSSSPADISPPASLFRHAAQSKVTNSLTSSVNKFLLLCISDISILLFILVCCFRFVFSYMRNGFFFFSIGLLAFLFLLLLAMNLIRKCDLVFFRLVSEKTNELRNPGVCYSRAEASHLLAVAIKRFMFSVPSFSGKLSS